MTTQLLAVLAAFCFAASQVSTKRGLQDTTILGGILISLVSAWATVALGVLVLSPPRTLDATGVVLFAVSGLISPGISRWVATVAIDRLGPSTSAPIAQSTRPLIALVAASVVLGETLSAPRIVGSAGIIIGGWRLSTIKADEGDGGKTFRSRQLRPGFLLPIMAGTAHAVSDIGVKSALEHMSEPIFGAMIGMATSMVVWTAPSLSVRRLRERIHIGSDFPWMVVSGAFQGLALLSLFSALEQGDVSLVSPIVAIQPLAVFLLSRLLLRRLEGLQPATVLAGSMVVAGTIIVSL